MQTAEFMSSDPELGSFEHDHHLPLVRLRERRRELVLSLQGQPVSLMRERLREIAEIQQAIEAIETVIAE